MSYLPPASAFGRPPRRIPHRDVRCPVCDRPPHLIGQNPAYMLDVTAREFGFTVEELTEPRRWMERVRARAFYVWAMRTLGVPRSYGKLGRDLGGYTKRAMIHLHEKAILLRLRDEQFAGACARLAERFYTAREHTHGIR